jgi:hypothetical protein
MPRRFNTRISILFAVIGLVLSVNSETIAQKKVARPESVGSTSEYLKRSRKATGKVARKAGPGTNALFNPANVADLIAAINAANTNGENDVINLTPGATYTLTAVDNNVTGNGPTGLPTILNDGTLTINGNGAIIERDSTAPSFRIFFCEAGSNLTLNNLTLRNGIAVSGGFLTRFGGAICTVQATLTMNDCTVSDSITEAGSGAGGGGLTASRGTTVLNRCTFNNNVADYQGGGVNNNEGSLTMTNCTISGNSVRSAAGGFGGGLLNASFDPAFPATASLTNCTFAENTSADPTVGISICNSTVADNAQATLTYRNTIVSGVGSDQVSNLPYLGTSTLTSDNNNICSDATGNLTQPNDHPSTDALLGPLANNGGPTRTHLPAGNSVAIDGGRAISGNTGDQRAVARPQEFPTILNAGNGDGTDIGAIEVFVKNLNSQVALGISGQSVLPETTCNPPYPNRLVLTANLINNGTTRIVAPYFQVIELSEASGTPPAFPFRLISAQGATCSSGGLVGSLQPVGGDIAPAGVQPVTFEILLPALRKFKFLVSVGGGTSGTSLLNFADRRPVGDLAFEIEGFDQTGAPIVSAKFFPRNGAPAVTVQNVGAKLVR